MSQLRRIEIPSGRLKSYAVYADRKWDVDPPEKSFHGGVRLGRYLDGHTHTKHGKERDSRRQKLYDAENSVQSSELEEHREFDSLEAAGTYIQNVFSKSWWQRRYNVTSVRLRPGYGAGRAIARSNGGSGSDKIILPSRVRNNWWILHELIHLTVPKPHAGHGRLFCARFLEIIGWEFGDDVRWRLKKYYQKHNVKWHPRRSVPSKYLAPEYA